VAHEINNPLAGVQNAVLLLKKAVPADHPNARFAGLAEKEIRRMAEIIRQMVMLYRPPPQKRNDCDAVAAVKETMQILVTDSRSQGISVNVADDTVELPVRMNEGELRQVIYNIVINALQASSKGSEVKIRFGRDGNFGRISVSDRGPGIPDDLLARIFEPFFGDSKTGDQVNLGLGLSVSRTLLEGAGGRIDLETEVGNGSTFTIVVPLGEESAPEALGIS
jgi:two-component system sporulation sensor kinase C